LGTSLRTVPICLVVLVFGLSLYANASSWVSDPEQLAWFPPFEPGVDLNRRTHLGAEYYKIAKAIVEGRGFSDPFGAGTGPTAWMPPAYPALLAALLWALGSKAAVGWAVVLLKNLVLVWVGLQVYAVAKATALRIHPVWAVTAYAVWLVGYFGWFFQFTHDTWLLLLLVTADFSFAHRVLSNDPPRIARLPWPVAWGLLGGLNALTSPIAGVTWAAAAGFLLLRDRRNLRALAIAGGLAALLVAPWLARNAVVFDRLILMKSNPYFDLYFANHVSPSGVYDAQFFKAYHPYFHARKPGSRYRELGELKYLDRFKNAFHERLRAEPEVYLRKAGRRLLAATVVFHPHRPDISGRHPPFRTAIHALPLVGLVVLLALRGRRLQPAQGLAAVLYVTYLAPYVVAAFYNRYLMPVSALLVLFCFWGVDAVAARRRGPATRSNG